MMNTSIEIILKLVLGIIGVSAGIFFSKRIGYSRSANALKIIVIILLILFVLWNEGVFG